jgi:hypothetical protein
MRVSTLASWQRCPRRTYLSTIEGWDTADRNMTAAWVGTVVHAWLAEYYGGDLMSEVDTDIYEKLFVDDQVMAQAMYTTYVNEVEQEGLDIGSTTVSVENRLYGTYGGVEITGMLDRIYYDELRQGHVVQDHKTVGQFFQTSPVDFQLMTYASLARRSGVENIVAIEHNQIKRNKRTGRAKPPFVNRTWQPTNDHAIDMFEAQLNILAVNYDDIVAEAQENQGVESPSVHAHGRNDCSFVCSFSEVCGMLSTGEDFASVLETEYIKGSTL